MPQPVCSSLTGNTVLVNYDSRRFALLPFSPAKLAAARADWVPQADWAGKQGGQIRPAIDACFSAADAGTFEAAVAALLAESELLPPEGADHEHGVKGGRLPACGYVNTAFVGRALTLLWKHELLLWPAGGAFLKDGHSRRAIPEATEAYFGRLADLITRLERSPRWLKGYCPIRWLILTCAHLSGVGDLDTNVLAGFAPHMPGPHRWHRDRALALADVLWTSQQAEYANDPEMLARIPRSYRGVLGFSRSPGRRDPAFQWAEGVDERVNAWRRRAVSYMASFTNRAQLTTEIDACNAFLDYVIATPSVPADAHAFFRRGFAPDLGFPAYLKANREQGDRAKANTLHAVAEFLDWVMEEETADDEGIVDPRVYRNPYAAPPASQGPWRGQTDRIAMPTRFMRMAREIIEEDDFAWPKKFAGDYVCRVNPTTGEPERIWCPVRAEFTLLRLHLPLRTTQTRLLDSGEGDALVYRIDWANDRPGEPPAGAWVPNTGPWAPPPGSARAQAPLGFLRQLVDCDKQRTMTGLFITTNKTADRATDFTDNGYEIPWEHPEIMRLFARVRDWQEAYNPSTGPKGRSELADVSLRASDDVAQRSPRYHYLFRDAANRENPGEPVTPARANRFWRLLMEELEERLAAAGITSAEGTRIEIVTSRGQSGDPNSCVFDPHSLRVSGITALVEAGVPIDIVARVVGHATVLMTLYYTKVGPAGFTRLMDEALVEIAAQETRQLAEWLKDKPLERIREIAVYASDEARDAARATPSALWSMMDDGFCPNGGTRCEDGGPQLTKGNSPKYSRVPGGSRNCPQCRHWVTGVPWLGGQVARLNEQGAALREEVVKLQDLQQQRKRRIEEVAACADAAGAASANRAVARLDALVDSTEDRIMEMGTTWVARLRAVQRTLAILEARRKAGTAGPGTAALVLNGAKIEARFEETAEYEAWDRICQSSGFYPDVDARIPALRRGRLFDALLSNAGVPAVFVHLSEQQLTEIGNQFATWLRMRLGPTADIGAVAEGQRILDAAGITEELQRILPAEVAQRLQPQRLQPGRVALGPGTAA